MLVKMLKNKSLYLALVGLVALSMGSLSFGMNNNGQQDIWQAIENGNVGRVRDLFKDPKFYVNKVYKLWKTPLYYACMKNNKEIVKLLIKKGTDVNSIVIDGDYEGCTPIHCACRNNNKEIVKLLIYNGANVDFKIMYGCYKGLTPIYFACKKYYIEIVKLLLEGGAEREGCFTYCSKDNFRFSPMVKDKINVQIMRFINFAKDLDSSERAEKTLFKFERFAKGDSNEVFEFSLNRYKFKKLKDEYKKFILKNLRGLKRYSDMTFSFDVNI